jgi:hypothetical protein
MRVTLKLDDDVVKILREYSRRCSVTLGKAASELIVRAASVPPKIKLVNGVWVVDLPKGGKKISSKRLKELDAEQDSRYLT